jgi:hypothetical protein
VAFLVTIVFFLMARGLRGASEFNWLCGLSFDVVPTCRAPGAGVGVRGGGEPARNGG